MATRSFCLPNFRDLAAPRCLGLYLGVFTDDGDGGGRLAPRAGNEREHAHRLCSHPYKRSACLDQGKVGGQGVQKSQWVMHDLCMEVPFICI